MTFVVPSKFYSSLSVFFTVGTAIKFYEALLTSRCVFNRQTYIVVFLAGTKFKFMQGKRKFLLFLHRCMGNVYPRNALYLLPYLNNTKQM